MNNLCSSYTRFTTIIGIITFLTLAGCDNPARSDEHEHDHPDGLYLKYEGDLIFEYSGATLIERKHLLLQTGKEYRFEVVWIDEHGDPISKNHIDGEDHFLEWDIENEAVLEIQQQKGDVLFSFQIGRASWRERVYFLVVDYLFNRNV